MSDFTYADSLESLFIAQEVEPRVAHGMWEVTRKYEDKYADSGVSPSDLEDHLSHEFGVSDYLISTILLDGEISNIQFEETEDSTPEEEELFYKTLKLVDLILWGKFQDFASREQTNHIRYSRKEQNRPASPLNS